MKKRFVASALGLAMLAVAGQSVVAKEINATMAAGHPPVFRWVKHTSKTFIPAVNKALEGSGHSIKWKEQYAGSLAKDGSLLEAVEEGLAEVGVVSTLFEQAKLSVQNVTYYTPFVSTDATAISNMIDNIIDALTGPIGRGLAVLALVGSGVMMFFGRLNWPIFVAVFVGVVMIFSAETIIDGFAAP